MNAVIRVAHLDDHPALRLGLEAILTPEPDLQPVGSAADEEEVWRLLRRTRPSVVVLDVHHPGRDGLSLTMQIKRALHPPAVVLYSAPTPGPLIVAAAVAGADAVVGKSSSARALLEAIRLVAREPRTGPPVSPRMRTEAAAQLTPSDHAIFAMRLAGDPALDIAATLALPINDVMARIAAIVATLAPQELVAAPSIQLINSSTQVS